MFVRAQFALSAIIHAPEVRPNGRDERVICEERTDTHQQYGVTVRRRWNDPAAATDAASQIHREHDDTLKQQAKDQAAVSAASAAEKAMEVATAGFVWGRTLNAVEKTLDEEHRANNERILRETQPTEQKMIGQTADIASDLAQQLQSNPGVARLVQLPEVKHCMGGAEGKPRRRWSSPQLKGLSCWLELHSFLAKVVIGPRVVVDLDGQRRGVAFPDLQYLVAERELVPGAKSRRFGNPGPIHVGTVRASKIFACPHSNPETSLSLSGPARRQRRWERPTQTPATLRSRKRGNYG